MSTWKFVDFAARIYDDPRIGRVEPGDTIEADLPPDWQYWCKVPVSAKAVPVVKEAPVKEEVETVDTDDGVTTPVVEEEKVGTN